MSCGLGFLREMMIQFRKENAEEYEKQCRKKYIQHCKENNEIIEA